MQTASSGAGDRTVRMLDKLKNDLQLTPDEVDKVRAGVEAEFVALKNSAPPGAGPSQGDAREQARMRITKVLPSCSRRISIRNTRTCNAPTRAVRGPAQYGAMMPMASFHIR